LLSIRLRQSRWLRGISASMGQSFTNLREKFVSVTFARQCKSASVRMNGGFVGGFGDPPLAGFDLALKSGFVFWIVRG